MKRLVIFVCIFFFLTACWGNKQRVEEEKQPSFSKTNDNFAVEEENRRKLIPIQTIDDERVFLVADFARAVEANYEYNSLHRTLTIEVDDQVFKFVYGIPVVEQNGIYLPTDEVALIVHENEAYLPINFLKVVGMKARTIDNHVSFQWYGNTLATSSSVPEHEWTVQEMIDYLSFLQKPIKGAKVSTIPNHLPGAKRAYRNGFHEGIDWYGYSSGKDISTSTPVYAMAEGIVVRIDHNYEEYSSKEVRNKDLAQTSHFGETPEYIFDRLRGRQVWVQYENGVMNRFAHLDRVVADIKVGDKVTSSTIIGYVGNSGTSGAVNKDGTQLHLHQDILIYGDLFWKPFTLEEVKEIVVAIFGD